MIKLQAISSLDKIFESNSRKSTEVSQIDALLGERVSYQLLIECTEQRKLKVRINSPLEKYITLYRERKVFCDLPVPTGSNTTKSDDDYIAREQCMIHDVLIPIEETNGFMSVNPSNSLVWVRVDIPKSLEPKSYEIEIVFDIEMEWENMKLPSAASNRVTINVLPYSLNDNDIKMTQWFHTDCIAKVHGTQIYSEEHWRLIDDYMAKASDIGINMLLTPIHTPPLDTAIGEIRPNVQLVDIEKKGEKYYFDFSKLEKWVKLCKKNGIKYLEMSHLFSQWGAKAAANIYVCENGETKLMFGWNTPSNGEEYRNFLKQYIPSVIESVKKLGYGERTYFHISDEPNAKNLELYSDNLEFLKPLLSGMKTFDALSDIEFFNTGMVKIPVCASDHIEPFLKEEIDERWVYYCSAQDKRVSNRFISMSSYRNRIMGIQMYKFNIDGFLQWGYNFYYSAFSRYVINPYLTTSADLAFPSGDAFTVYPSLNGAYHSVRGLVFFEGLQDMMICKLLEERIGREEVIKIIDETAGFDVRFDKYPKDDGYLFKLRKNLISRLR